MDASSVKEKEGEGEEEGEDWIVRHIYTYYMVVEEGRGFELRMSWIHISLLILWIQESSQ